MAKNIFNEEGEMAPKIAAIRSDMSLRHERGESYQNQVNDIRNIISSPKKNEKDMRRITRKVANLAL